MATPANTTSTYDAIGNREDLSDIIYDISPTTPRLFQVLLTPQLQLQTMNGKQTALQLQARQTL